jgi:hypothetical protein
MIHTQSQTHSHALKNGLFGSGELVHYHCVINRRITMGLKTANFELNYGR